MAQQTAVEWFQEKTWELNMQLERKEISIGQFAVQYKETFEQANQMFEEQIIKAHREQSYLQDDGSWLELTGEQYYKETYGTRLQNETN